MVQLFIGLVGVLAFRVWLELSSRPRREYIYTKRELRELARLDQLEREL